ncbi:MAG: hypothetical protein WBA13_00910 [Microcoleaceae cyanobacterium]
MTSRASLNSSESIALKALSGVGLAIFTSLMVVHWNNALSKVEVVEETAPPVTPSTTTNAAAAPPVPSASGVAPAATTTSAIATDSTTATTIPTTAPITTSTPTGSATQPITTTAPAQTAPNNLAAVESTPTITAPAPVAPSPQVVDPAQVEALEMQLYDTLDKGWTTYPSFGQDLVYKVTVDTDGSIVNYQPLHGAAVDYLNETPLDEVTPNSAAPGTDFVVVLTPTGVLEVDSWIGQ